MLTTILLIISLAVLSVRTATLPNAPYYILKKKYSYGDYRKACNYANMKPVFITESNIKTAYETMLGCDVGKVWVRGLYDPVTGEFNKNNVIPMRTEEHKQRARQ